MQKTSPVPPDDSHVKAEAIRSLPDETLCVVFDVAQITIGLSERPEPLAISAETFLQIVPAIGGVQ